MGEFFNLPSAQVSAEARRAMFHSAPTDAVTRIGSVYVRYSEIPSEKLRRTIQADAPMVHILFEVLPADLKGASLIPIRHQQESFSRAREPRREA